MWKIVKIVLIYCCCFNSFQSIAQLNEYLQLEERRTLISEKTEVEIQDFINYNFNNYKLSEKITSELIKHLRHEEKFTDAELEAAIVNAKKHELRKLFFKNNPDKKESYVANTIPPSISQTCVNGDFEDNTAGYSFWSDLHPQPSSGSDFFLSCATPTALSASNVISPTTNNFNSRATIINSASPGYQQFDPLLVNFGVNVPTLNTNGGTKCIKLNNTGGYGSSDLTTVSRYFPVINQSTIDFNFSLVMDNKPEHEQEIQPYFRVRVRDQFGNIVDEICIIANPNNCLFNTINVSEDRRILYTGWLCARLNVSEILNQPGTIEFSVSDCQPSAHFGTVYIDNICGIICSAPQLGALSIDPINFNCPSTINNVPIEVCGTYQTPLNSNLNTLTLNITQNGSVVGTVNAPYQLTANTFCFSIAPNLFGTNPSGNFEFEIHATFNVNCAPGTFVYDISDYSSSIGPDVTFVDCCVPTLTLVSPADNHNNLDTASICKRERSDWIKAANIISVGNNDIANGVVYHAENFVELNPGFEAVFGAQFAAYPEGCTATYVYKEVPQAMTQTNNDEEVIKLIKIQTSFAIFPNPSSKSIQLKMNNGSFNQISIVSIDGKKIYEIDFENNNEYLIDISNYVDGIYIVNITTEDGQILSQKLIKN